MILLLNEGMFIIPVIKSSADLRNKYNEISSFCHSYPETVFITKNGKGDLAVMSIEAYEELTSRFELYSQINLKKPTAAGHLPDVATEQLTLRYAAKVLSCR